jgi:hypothetical protein
LHAPAAGWGGAERSKFCLACDVEYLVGRLKALGRRLLVRGSGRVLAMVVATASGFWRCRAEWVEASNLGEQGW